MWVGLVQSVKGLLLKTNKQTKITTPEQEKILQQTVFRFQLQRPLCAALGLQPAGFEFTSFYNHVSQEA
jgi:hypothetical protein